MSNPLNKALNALTGNSRASTGRGSKQTRATTKRRRRSRRRAQANHYTGSAGGALGRMQAAPVNMRGDVLSTNTRAISEFGTDLFYKGTLSGQPRDALVIDEVITTGSFRRLAKASAMYQRVIWDSLWFEVIMQTPTTTPGGYACTFVRDPTDKYETGAESYSRLISNQGTKIQKMWENCQVRMPGRRDLLYTSTDTEPRLYSPGKFVFMVDHPAGTAPADVSIYAHWRVRLSDPTLEEASEEIRALTSIVAVGVAPEAGQTSRTQLVTGGSPPNVIFLPSLFGGETEDYTELVGETFKFPQTVSLNDLDHSYTRYGAGFVIELGSTGPYGVVVNSVGTPITYEGNVDSETATIFPANTIFYPWEVGQEDTILRTRKREGETYVLCPAGTKEKRVNGHLKNLHQHILVLEDKLRQLRVNNSG